MPTLWVWITLHQVFAVVVVGSGEGEREGGAKFLLGYKRVEEALRENGGLCVAGSSLQQKESERTITWGHI